MTARCAYPRPCACERCIARRRRQWSAAEHGTAVEHPPILDLPRFTTPTTAPRRPYRED